MISAWVILTLMAALLVSTASILEKKTLFFDACLGVMQCA